ncbi:MAG: lysine-sensitive aspartokinase 3 [Bacteroidota bacterium]|nr:lysine-sensitive aspartokinase 3 [Bacteroidota bacterium]
MIVMKFGGTSVEDGAAIRRLIEIVKRELPKQIIVVVSACSGVTNELIRCAHTVKNGSESDAMDILDTLHKRHTQIIGELIKGNRLATLTKQIDEYFSEIKNIVRGVNLLGELTPRTLDLLTSYGERLSSLIIHSALEESGISSNLFDARKVMITDSSFGSAKPLFDKIEERIKIYLIPVLKKNHVVITQGFIGATEEGITTTIGRGGSDYSASIFGSILSAETIQIWTDVDGMMSADPRIVSESKLITTLSFNEASELAYFGAKVLHPNTILPAVQKNIPVKILNSRRPEIQGTLILQSTESENKSVVKSIASKKGIIVINVASSRMFLAHGFLAKLFSIFADHQKSVDVVSTSEVSVSLTIDNDKDLDQIRKDLEDIGEIRIERKKGIVCIVGEGMKKTPGIAAKAFNALAKADINIEMISEGASEINLTLVVDEEDVDKVVRVLHNEYFS